MYARRGLAEGSFVQYPRKHGKTAKPIMTINQDMFIYPGKKNHVHVLRFVVRSRKSGRAFTSDRRRLHWMFLTLEEM